jgi:hypothetical protein
MDEFNSEDFIKTEKLKPLDHAIPDLVKKYALKDLLGLSLCELLEKLELLKLEIKKHKHKKGERDMWNMYRNEIKRVRYYARSLVSAQ